MHMLEMMRCVLKIRTPLDLKKIHSKTKNV